MQLAFNKAKYGTCVDWIGVTFTVYSDRIVAAIPTEKLNEFLEIVDRMFGLNMASPMNIASLLYVWRPFLSAFWAAISSESGLAPQNCRWVKQIAVSLWWLKAFLTDEPLLIERVFTLDVLLPRHIS